MFAAILPSRFEMLPPDTFPSALGLSCAARRQSACLVRGVSILQLDLDSVVISSVPLACFYLPFPCAFYHSIGILVRCRHARDARAHHTGEQTTRGTHGHGAVAGLCTTLRPRRAVHLILSSQAATFNDVGGKGATRGTAFAGRGWTSGRELSGCWRTMRHLNAVSFATGRAGPVYRKPRRRDGAATAELHLL